MFCPNCGKELPDGSKFCGFCGADIAKELKGGNVTEKGAASTGFSFADQSFGGYDPLGNVQMGDQTNNNQYGANQNNGGQYNSGQYNNGQYNSGQYNNGQYNGGQFDNNQYYNPQYSNGALNTPYGNSASGNVQQNQQKKSKKGIIAAIVAVILVLAIGGSAAAYHFISSKNSKNKDDDEKDVAASSSTSEDDSAAAATTEPDDEDDSVSGEEALELACKNLAEATDYTTTFTYSIECSVEAEEEGVSGSIIEEGEFEVVTDLDVNSDDPDANILEVAEGTVTRDVLGVTSEEDIIVSRGSFSGEFLTSIEYESGDKYEGGENEGTVDTVLGFIDYDLYDAQLQDETQKVEGVECYVYVSEKTYDQGGLSSVFTPISSIYNGSTDLCTVKIYVSTKEAELVKVETSYTDIDDDPLEQAFNEYTGAEDIEFSMDKLEYSIVFTEFNSGVDVDPDFEDLLPMDDNQNCSFDQYISGLIEVGDFDFTEMEDEDDAVEDDDTEYVNDSYGALTYDVPKDWSGEEVSLSGYNGCLYTPSDDNNTAVLVMYEEMDLSGLTESEQKQLIDLMLTSICTTYGLSTDDIKKGTVNGGYAENITGTVTESGMEMDVDVMAFNCGGNGIGMIIFVTDDIDSSDYHAQYYHLLESLEF